MDQNEIARSDEVQDLLEQVPHWLIRSGNLVILIIVIVFLMISWVLKYPDVIESSATLTTDIPPQKEYAKVGGKFEAILVENNQLVEPGEPLAVIENNANFKDIFLLKEILDTTSFEEDELKFPLDLVSSFNLGELDVHYGAFERNYIEYKLNKELQPLANEKVASKFSVQELRYRLDNSISQLEIYERELDFKRKELERYTKLKQNGVISDQEFEKKSIEFAQMERNLKGLLASISQIKEQIKLSEKNSKGFEIDQAMNEIVSEQNLIQSLIQLKNQIQTWEDKYVLQSNIEGKVSFFSYWSENQTAHQGDLIFTIIPQNFNSYLAKLKVPTHNSGKIRTGQEVQIDLESFPEREYGILEGKVKSITNLPDNNGYYLVDVSLDSSLVTSFNKDIDFKHEMLGGGTIITEDLRLLERIFSQLRNNLNR